MSVDATNLSETILTLEVPDTVVVSQPHTVHAGSGTFQQTVHWTVDHVREGKRTPVEITVSDGHTTQKALVEVVG